MLQFYKFPIVSYMDFKALLLIFKALHWFVAYYIWLGYCYHVSTVSHYTKIHRFSLSETEQ